MKLEEEYFKALDFKAMSIILNTRQVV